MRLANHPTAALACRACLPGHRAQPRSGAQQAAQLPRQELRLLRDRRPPIATRRAHPVHARADGRRRQRRRRLQGAIAAHAGGGHIVILRAVADDSFDPGGRGLRDSFATKWGPVASAETIIFHNRQAAYDPRVLAALHGADGIFLAGGDQGNYVRYWKGTPVQEALNAHVRAIVPSAAAARAWRSSDTTATRVSMASAWNPKSRWRIRSIPASCWRVTSCTSAGSRGDHRLALLRAQPPRPLHRLCGAPEPGARPLRARDRREDRAAGRCQRACAAGGRIRRQCLGCHAAAACGCPHRRTAIDDGGYSNRQAGPRQQPRFQIPPK